MYPGQLQKICQYKSTNYEYLLSIWYSFLLPSWNTYSKNNCVSTFMKAVVLYMGIFTVVNVVPFGDFSKLISGITSKSSMQIRIVAFPLLVSDFELSFFIGTFNQYKLFSFCGKFFDLFYDPLFYFDINSALVLEMQIYHLDFMDLESISFCL